MGTSTVSVDRKIHRSDTPVGQLFEPSKSASPPPPDPLDIYLNPWQYRSAQKPAIRKEVSAARYFESCATSSTYSSMEPLEVTGTAGQISKIDICYEGFSKIDPLRAGAAGEIDEDIKKNAIAKVVPATVQIRVVGNNKQSWSGSGFILDPADAAALLPGSSFPKGTYFISTNQHVADEAKKITIITADGKRTLEAQVVKNKDGKHLIDAVADTALLMIKSDEELPTAKIGDPNSVVHGDTVLTAGFPLGFPKISVTKGIISQPRQVTGESLLALQTDAAINPGNSGGPLFTLNGLVIGTNTYTFKGSNDMSFAQPITEQFAVLSNIWNKGEHVRGDLGIELKEFGTFAREAEGLPEGITGAVIEQVKPGSKAAELKIASGDVISTIEVLEKGGVVRTITLDVLYNFQRTQAMSEIYNLTPGQDVRIRVYRRDNTRPITYKEDTLTLTVAKLDKTQSVESESWGMRVVRDNQGDLLITDVMKGSPAAKGGIEGEGKWVLRGIRARELGNFEPIMIRSAYDFKKMLESLSDLGTTEMLVYLEDAVNCRIRKAVSLSRDLSGYLFVRSGDPLLIGAERIVA